MRVERCTLDTITIMLQMFRPGPRELEPVSDSIIHVCDELIFRGLRI